jgi:hypothetical protein
MRQESCSTGKCMELGLLVMSRARICLVQPKTRSSVYLMICAPYQTDILFYWELHGTEPLSKLSYLGPSCEPETLSSLYIMNCAPYETCILFYRELHGIGSLSTLLYFGLYFAT